MKKYIVVVAIIAIIACILPHQIVYADEIEGLNSNVSEQLENINFDKINNLLQDLQQDYSYIGNESFKDKVSQILSGEYFTNYSSLLSSVASIFFGQVKQLLPTIMLIIVIAIMCSMINSFKSSKFEGVSALAHFACYGIIILLVTISIKNVATITKNTVGSMQNQMNAIFPILLTLLTAVGSVSSVSIYSPVVSILSGAVSAFFTKITYPVFILAFVFVVIGHLSDTIKLKKFNGFLSSTFKWAVGILFTLFSGLLAIQGISAGKADGLSIKLTKFTVKSYIPIIGTYIRDRFDMVVLSSLLIKNAVGVVGLIVLILSALTPIITIVILKLSLKLCAGLVEPLGNSKLSSFLDECSQVLIYPIIIIIAVALMYFLTLSLMVCTANIV